MLLTFKTNGGDWIYAICMTSLCQFSAIEPSYSGGLVFRQRSRSSFDFYGCILTHNCHVGFQVL